MKTAVVTGANGFFGKALVRVLDKNHVHTYAVVKNRSSDISGIQKLENIEIIYCDMAHLASLKEKIKEKVDVFFHLAWQGSTGAARSYYALQLDNAKWTVDAVKAAHEMGGVTVRFVGAGTLAEHDVNTYVPLDGSSPNPVSCYGSAKLAAHYMSKAESSQYANLEHCWAYLSNTYGIGNYTSNFVNFAAKLMLTGQPADFTAGDQLYDFVFVEDTAQGLYCVGEQGRKNTAYYIGSGHPRPLKRFIQEIRNQINPEIELHLGAVPFHGISQPPSVFNCEKLMKDTDYAPKVSFKEGLQVTIPWIREQILQGGL